MAAKILVVDDDPNVQRLLQYTLKQEGYDVVVASDGAEGFRLWGAEAPDLILLDVMLPKLDGYQVATKIRTEEGDASHVPIIMLTAEREVEQKVRGLRAGADDYLIKPFHPAELLARIKSLLARFAPRDVAARPAAARPHPRVLRRQGRRRDDDDRDQRRDRAPSRARAQGLPGRRQPAVRRPPGLPRPRARSQEHRRRRDGAVDRLATSSGRSWSSTIRASTCCSRRRRPRPPSWSDPEHLPVIIEHLRDLYDYMVIDIDKRLDDVNLGVFEAAETIFVVMTADLSCLKNVRLDPRDDRPPRLPAAKVQLVLNRSNAFTGINVKNAEGALRADDRAPGRQRVPRRDQRAQLGRAVHVHEGRLGARRIAAPLRAAVDKPVATAAATVARPADRRSPVARRVAPGEPPVSGRVSRG